MKLTVRVAATVVFEAGKTAPSTTFDDFEFCDRAAAVARAILDLRTLAFSGRGPAYFDEVLREAIHAERDRRS